MSAVEHTCSHGIFNAATLVSGIDPFANAPFLESKMADEGEKVLEVLLNKKYLFMVGKMPLFQRQDPINEHQFNHKCGFVNRY